MQATGLEPKKDVAYFEYDFSKHGGAVGDITVEGDALPAGALIDIGKVHVKTACTSGGSATVVITALSSGDIMASTAVASLSANALLDTEPDGTAANMIRTTSNLTSLTFTIGTAALTAGKIAVALEYYITSE